MSAGRVIAVTAGRLRGLCFWLGFVQSMISAAPDAGPTSYHARFNGSKDRICKTIKSGASTRQRWPARLHQKIALWCSHNTRHAGAPSRSSGCMGMDNMRIVFQISCRVVTALFAIRPHDSAQIARGPTIWQSWLRRFLLVQTSKRAMLLINTQKSRWSRWLVLDTR